MEVTFYRAFDETHNIEISIKELVNFKIIDRVLTSGIAETVIDGIDVLKK
ncbi:MAG: copper homeostasis protein CutC [Ignavibacteriaceae bacterium]